jgi:hypothetical protein
VQDRDPHDRQAVANGVVGEVEALYVVADMIDTGNTMAKVHLLRWRADDRRTAASSRRVGEMACWSPRGDLTGAAIGRAVAMTVLPIAPLAGDPPVFEDGSVTSLFDPATDHRGAPVTRALAPSGS